MSKLQFVILITGIILFSACRKDNTVLTTGVVTPYEIDYPQNFTDKIGGMEIPADNPMTVQGINLGRELFYETMLSADNTQACATCHAVETGFNDPLQFSIGIDGLPGKRHSMPLFNVGYAKELFWDGRASSLEMQAFIPVTDELEMHNTWPNAVAALQATDKYPALFYSAFGTEIIDSMLVAKALAQFERTLISGNSPYDKFLRGEPTGYTTPQLILMQQGEAIFESEVGDCMHCHGSQNNPLFTDNEFHNNGLDAMPQDPGYANVTGEAADHGKFRTPSVRNLLFTAPYMHDGRFNTISEVIDHYSFGIHDSPTIDPLIKNIDQGGINITPANREALIFFLESLTDSSLLTNPAFQSPK